MKFFDELKRRNVLRIAAAYIVSAWLVIQVAETILPSYALENYVRTVITMLAIGFLPAMILAWALEWTPEGIKLDAGAEAEATGAALGPTAHDVFVALLGPGEALTRDRQHAGVQRDFDMLRVDARNVDVQLELVVELVDVDARDPVGRYGTRIVRRSAGKQAVDVVLQAADAHERIVIDQ